MSENGEMPEKLSPKEAAIFLGKSITTLQEWRNQKTGPPYIREVGRIYYLMRDLDRWRLAIRTDTLSP